MPSPLNWPIATEFINNVAILILINYIIIHFKYSGLGF